MSRVSFSPAAATDIEEIWDYTAERWGIDQADSYTDNIRDACLALASGIKKGREVDIRAGYRKHPVGRHFVFFRALDSGIVVIRVLHQRMDVNRPL